MKRKKIIVVTLLVLSTFFGAKSMLWAQKSYEDKVERITMHMTKKLNLTEGQREKVYMINLKKAEAYKELKNTRESLSRKDRKLQFKSKITDWKNELKQVLTQEQIEKMRI